MKKPGRARPHAQTRQSQVITTFGPGSMVDLPDRSVVIGGLDHWLGDRVQIHEERLIQKVEKALGLTGLQLFAPPVDRSDPGEERTGVTAWRFPEWFVAQCEERRPDGVRTRPLVAAVALVKDRYFGPDKKRYPVVPIRFVRACLNGHLSDVRWVEFVHGKGVTCGRALWLDEKGTSGELADIFVRCECGKRKSLLDATFGPGREAPLGYCGGERPWLGRMAREQCGGAGGKAQPNRLLIRSASNSYFSQVMSVISIPSAEEELRKAIDLVWEDFLQYVEGPDDLARERRKEKVRNALEGLADDRVLGELTRRKRGGDPTPKSIKQAEIETLLASPGGYGGGMPTGDFYARRVEIPDTPALLQKLDRVVRVDRLREVSAQVGFTRFESVTPDVDGELDVEVRRASLASDVRWLPAIENRGEGVFLSLRPDIITSWLGKAAVKTRGDALVRGFEAWSRTHHTGKAKAPGLPYVLLHSLSHLLITAVSLECGYAASSIRERIYTGLSGYGILLHTGTPDAEGTLGGLVQVVRHLDRHLRNAIELGRLCSNDPVCAEHHPDDERSERFLQGAACHGCLLIAEPSCERRNEHLDRALVVETVAGLGAAFFEDSDL